MKYRAISLLTVLCICPVLSHAENLVEVYQMALQNDTLLKSQEATHLANTETENINRAALLPQINANATHSETDVDIQGTACPKAGTNRCNNVDTSVDNIDVSLSQNIVNFAAWYDYKQGKYVRERSDAQIQADRQDLIVRVTDAYLGVLEGVVRLDTARAQEAAFSRQLDQSKQRFDVGLVAITDVQEAQASFDSARVDTITAEGNIGVAFDALEQITGQPIKNIATLGDDLPINMPVPATASEWVTQALANNFDVKASEAAMKAADENAKARRAGHLPTVTASAQYLNDDSSTHYHPETVTRDQDGASLALNLQVPLFSGGGISAKRRQAAEQYTAAMEQYNYVQRTAVQNTRSLHLIVVTTVERIKARLQAVLSSQTALDATQAGYEVGTRNIVDVLNAEKALYDAKLAYELTRYQYLKGMLKLKKMAGTLEAPDLNKFNQHLLQDKAYPRPVYQ